MFGWVTTASEREYVAVTTVAGAPLATGEGLGQTKPSGEKQRWAKVDGLAPATIYCYAIVSELGPLTERTGFRTAPAADATRPIRFLAFGDSAGGGRDQLALRDEMFHFPFDFVIDTGDLANDEGTIRDFERNVFRVYAELLRNVPLFPSPGNHDYKTIQTAPFSEVFAVFADRNRSWYSYDWGRIHFAALDTGADYATQARWLEADLKATEEPWKIVYLHRPPYSSGAHGSDVALRNALAPVFEKHHVQLVLSGHDHDYERILPQHGVTYVVTGGGGRGTRRVGRPSFTAFSADVIHFVIVDVGMDELVLHAIDATGVEFDSMVVPRR